MTGLMYKLILYCLWTHNCFTVLATCMHSHAPGGNLLVPCRGCLGLNDRWLLHSSTLLCTIVWCFSLHTRAVTAMFMDLILLEFSCVLLSDYAYFLYSLPIWFQAWLKFIFNFWPMPLHNIISLFDKIAKCLFLRFLKVLKFIHFPISITFFVNVILN